MQTSNHKIGEQASLKLSLKKKVKHKLQLKKMKPV